LATIIKLVIELTDPSKAWGYKPFKTLIIYTPWYEHRRRKEELDEYGIDCSRSI
jgi:hypothetical protein